MLIHILLENFPESFLTRPAAMSPSLPDLEVCGGEGLEGALLVRETDVCSGCLAHRRQTDQ